MKMIGFVARLGPCIASAVLLAGCASHAPAPVVGRDGQASATSSVAKPKDVYVVKAGDTLYSIAREHGMDHRELITMNSIENPNQIAVGRTLKVRPQGGATTSPVTSPVVVAQPISVDSSVEKRPLASNNGDSASTAANTATFKHEPKGGKEPYSEQALAKAQGQAVTPPVAVGSEKPAETKPAETVAAGSDEVPWGWPASGKTIGTFSESGSKGLDIAGKAGDPVVAAGDGRVVYAGTGLRGYGKLVILKHNNTYLSAYAHNQNILVKEGQSVSKGQKIAEMGNSDADQVKLHFEVRRQGKPVDPLKYLPAR